MKNKITSCFALKAVAFILAVFSLVGAVAGTVAAALLLESGHYNVTARQLRNDVFSDLMASQAAAIAQAAILDEDGAAARWNADTSNLVYQVSVGGFVLEGNRGQTHYYKHLVNKYPLSHITEAFLYPSNEEASAYALSLPGIQKWLEIGGDAAAMDPQYIDFTLPEVTVELWLLSELDAPDVFALADTAIRVGCFLRDNALPILSALWLLALVCTVYLLCAAGHRQGREGIALYAVDRIPMDVYTAGCGLALILLANLIFETYPRNLLYALMAALAILAATALALGWLLSLAARAKAGTLFQNTLIWRVLRLCWRGLSAAGRAALWGLQRLPLVWKSILVITALCAVNLFGLMATTYDDDVLIWWFLCCGFTGLAGLAIALNLKQLQAAIRRMAGGDLTAQVDERYLFGDFRRSGQDLGHIREGMTAAVDQQMKSERLKTELITNVSHDIKTPLTSIINYVDLIKKEQPESETLREYIGVLERQSDRLKKLIEDLIEASKASSGAIASHPEPCDLGVLLTQTAGEYSEKLAAAGLTPVLHTPETPVVVLADGRHLWRVFDNLMNNICKYAQAGTRVYMTLTAQDKTARVTLRNISREELNITPDELSERFVRGDRSRHTEGSGLGLSIARSLAQLQGGALDISVDGDLFKVTVTLPTA